MPDTTTLAQLVEQLRAEQRTRWRRDERVPAEDILRRHPALRDDATCALLLVYQEVVLREERGEAPRLEEYRRRFPQLAARLGPLFEVHQALEAGLLQGSSAGATMIAPAAAGAAKPRLAVPGYEVLAELGRGGMGVVYRARHLKLKRLVALKMILAGAHASPEQLARFRTEAEAVARLQHPNIVQIYEVGEHDGLPYLALELVEGGSLEKQFAGGTPVPAGRRAAALVEVLARAIHYAHRRGVVHRDLKPANVLLTEDGTPKLTDFGLAKRLDEDGQTVSGTVLGTPAYMAPEQAGHRGGPVGPAADVYALGAVLYELVTGRPVFRGATPLETMAQVVSAAPVPPSARNPDVSPDLEAVCLKCLEKEPAKRYDSADALAEDLRRLQAWEPVAARPVAVPVRAAKWARRRPAVAALLAVAAALLGAGTVTSTYFALKAETRAEQAEEAACDARREKEAAALARLEAEKSAEVAREKEQAAAAALAQAEVLSADILLRRVGYQYPTGLTPITLFELGDLAELAGLPPERERVRLLFVERALARPDTAEQLGRRADMAAHAAVGLDRARRERILAVVRARLRDPATDGRTRIACAEVVAALAAPDEDCADEAAGVLLLALSRIDRNRDGLVARALLDDVTLLAGRLRAARAEEVLAEVGRTLDGNVHGYVAESCGEASVALAPRVPEGPERDRVAAVILPALAHALGGIPRTWPAHAALARALAAVAGKGGEDKARGAAAREAAELLDTLLGTGESERRLGVGGRLPALLDCMGPKEARDVASRALAALMADPLAASPSAHSDRCRTIAPLLAYLDEAEADKAAGALLARLLDGVLGGNDSARKQDMVAGVVALAPQVGAKEATRAAERLVTALTGAPSPDWAHAAAALKPLAGRLGPADAESIATRLFEVHDRPPASRLVAVHPFPVLAGRLSPEGRARLAPKFLAALLRAPDRDTRQQIAASLALLADGLGKTQADADLPRLRDLVLGCDPSEQEAVAAALAAVAGRADPGPARKACAEAAAKVLKDMAKLDQQRHPARGPGPGPGGAGGPVGPGTCRRAGRPGGTATPGRSGGVRGLRRARGGRPGPAAAGAPARPGGGRRDRRPGARRPVRVADTGRAALTDVLEALVRPLARDEAAAVAGRVLVAYARTDSSLMTDGTDERAHLLTLLGALAERLDRPQLVNLLKHPACVRAARTVVLRRCEDEWKQKFADVWVLVGWLAANDPGADVLSPPRLPPP